MFYSGHGQIGMMQFSENEMYFYSNLINDFVTSINTHTKALYKEKDFSKNTFYDDKYKKTRKGLGWFVNIFVDCCYSGSAI